MSWASRLPVLGPRWRTRWVYGASAGVSSTLLAWAAHEIGWLLAGQTINDTFVLPLGLAAATWAWLLWPRRRTYGRMAWTGVAVAGLSGLSAAATQTVPLALKRIGRASEPGDWIALESSGVDIWLGAASNTIGFVFAMSILTQGVPYMIAAALSAMFRDAPEPSGEQ